jgi:pyruvoyl-dependent arginine decarboxylase (PvlArgDC)
MIDVESNGAIPGDFSMISFEAALVDSNLEKLFMVSLSPYLRSMSPKHWLSRFYARRGFGF